MLSFLSYRCIFVCVVHVNILEINMFKLQKSSTDLATCHFSHFHSCLSTEMVPSSGFYDTRWDRTGNQISFVKLFTDLSPWYKQPLFYNTFCKSMGHVQ